MIPYSVILREHVLNIFKDILTHIKKGHISDSSIIVEFQTNYKDNVVPDNIKKRFPDNVKIIFEDGCFSELDVSENGFSILLGFGNSIQKLYIAFDSILSFSDKTYNVSFTIPSELPKDEG